MHQLSREYKILWFDEFLERVVTKKTLKGTALVTFDDGFRSVFEDLYPSLRMLNIPFVVFVNSRVGENTKLLWYQKIAIVLQRKRQVGMLHELEQRGWKGIRVMANVLEPTWETMRTPLLKFYNHGLYNEVLDRILGDMGICEEAEAKRASLYLSREDLWSMRDLCTIGNHTHSHSNIATLSSEELTSELERCNVYIRSVNSQEIIPFAVPFGPQEFMPSHVQKAVMRYCFPVFTGYGYGNLSGAQSHFRRICADRLEYSGLLPAIANTDDVRHYLFEWSRMASARWFR
jgi:peptidoglycan/xylan/chitin deacetylase (PgdA/CDA1 family)